MPLEPLILLVSERVYQAQIRWAFE